MKMQDLTGKVALITGASSGIGPDGIRVSLIEPGAVWTEWGHNVAEGAMSERRSKLDALHAEDIAQALVYAFAQPPNVNVQELLVMPVKQTYP